MLPLLLACSLTENNPVSEDPKPNVVLITMDTTRKDHLGAYGYKNAGTPRIDAFANSGYLFTNAYSSIPLTTPAHASMLTGLYPPHHGIRNNGDATLPDEIETLPEYLKIHGYQTVGSISAFVTTRIWNLHQGFDVYFDDIATQSGGRWAQERPAVDVVDDLIDWWSNQRNIEQPFFMWAHLYDPHHPHVVHPGYESYEKSYDAEIAYMNDQIDRLYQHLSMDSPNTIWVLIADHGEAFEGQHGEKSHGLFLYEETMTIPWIVQPYPPLQQTQTISMPTSVVDLPNTILGLLGLPGMKDIDGINAVTESRTTPVYMESNTVQQRFGYHPEIAVSDGAHKLMPTPDPHLYDLQNDPLETQNIYPTTSSEKWQYWTTIGRDLYEDAPKFDLNSPDASVMKQLEALGYMGGNNGDGKSLGSYDIDAKGRLGTIAELTDILNSRKNPATNLEDIIVRFEELLLKEPQLGEARLMLGQTYAAVGRKDEAIRTFEFARDLNPDSVVVALNLSNLHADMGNFPAGIAILEGVLSQVENDTGAQSNLLRMLSDSGAHQEAIARGSAWLSERPSAQLQAILGVILIRNQQWELGTELLTASVSDGTPREHVHRSLGHIALRNNNIALALNEFEIELNHFPDPELHLKIAKLYEQRSDWVGAGKHHCELTHLRSQSARSHLNCAQSLFNQGEIEKAKEALHPAIQMVPNGPFILLLSANIAAKEGRTDEASTLFEKAKTERERQILEKQVEQQ